MVHNGIEYGLMAALAEGFGILEKANVGRTASEVDAETTTLRRPELYKYDFNLAEIAEVWRRGSVVSSWLLDLTASALRKSPGLGDFSGRVSDSGEGRCDAAGRLSTKASRRRSSPPRSFPGSNPAARRNTPTSCCQPSASSSADTPKKGVMMSILPTGRINALGQSLWLDDITRDLLDSGTLKRYIDEWSVTGLTSNPTIFDHAIHP